MTIRDMLAHHEAVLDDTAGDLPAPADPEPVLDDTAAPPAPSGWSPDDPEFLEAVDQRAAEIVRAQIGELQQRAVQQTPPGQEPPDLNEYLNPFTDTFGANLGDWLSQRDQFLLNQLDQRLRPMYEQQQQQEAARVAQPILDRDEAQHGPLPPEGQQLVGDLAVAYLPEMEARYGRGANATAAALQKALKGVRAIHLTGSTAGGQQAVDRLAAVAGADAQPSGGGTVLNMPQQAKSPRELYNRTFGLTS